MNPFGLTPDQVEGVIGAAKAVALADGTLEEHEAKALTAVANLLGCERPIDAIKIPDPMELSWLLGEEKPRERTIQGMLMMALMDGMVVDAELAIIRTFADALGITEPYLDSMRHLAAGHRRLVFFDMWRRSGMLRDAATASWERKGVRGLWSFFGGLSGQSVDPELARRWNRLGLLPEGSFGRTYWTHMMTRGFPFPGETKGFPEELTKHDLAHVLGGYDTDPEGECEAVAFISGFMKSDPFGYLLQILVHMQANVHVFNGSPTETLRVPVERLLAALVRGTAVTEDLYDPSWDYWPLFPEPIDAVRKKVGIAPKAASSAAANAR